MKIRLMKTIDYDQVVAVWKAAGLELKPVDDSSMAIAKLLDMNPTSCFVAEIDGRVVGAVLGAFNGRRLWIHHLAVLPKYQGQEIGKALLIAVEKVAVKQRVSKLCLGVDVNNLKVIGFYYKLGFGLTNDALWLNKELVNQERG